MPKCQNLKAILLVSLVYSYGVFDIKKKTSAEQSTSKDPLIMIWFNCCRDSILRD